MKVSIILPAYNEAERLEKAVKEVKNVAEKIGYDFEILIAEDGSKDGTDKIAAEIAKKDLKVKHLHSDERLGRGRALMNAIRKSEGDIVVFMDVDLSTDLSHLKDLIDAILIEKYDISIGSRLMKSSSVERPLKRELASRIYNFLVRFLLGSKVRDHQCGFKAFKKDVALKVGEKAKDNHWFWDTEVLVLAQRDGYKIKEIPVKWKHGGKTKVDLTRDSIYMLFQLLRMFFSEKKRKILVFSTFLAIFIILSLIYLSSHSFFDYFLNIKLDLVLIAFLVCLFSFALRGFRYSYILNKSGAKNSIFLSTAAISIGQTINVLTPIRIGDLARAYVLSKQKISYELSLGSLATERFFDVATVSFLAIVSSAYLGISTGEIYYGLAFTVLIIIIILSLSKMENFVGRIFRAAKKSINRKDFFVIFSLSIFVWLSDVFICYLILSSFFSNFPLATLAVAVGNIVKAIPITPGGIGTYEAALVAILSRSFDLGLATVVAIVDHAIKNITTILLGIISMLLLNIKLKDLR
ncbi:MAG: flippase-like domain-containing protein [Archaeoglobaceae archaeon]|nr:flippase-like domain-containing protein [Archaeoglobaceae archaeon]MCX8151673.1 flippase-like domain-containing protein [Archaeoglobaceae archaeon]MDW8013049.1 flippase-like domain-containing protein [Archaeoglobaceae archaeon]